MSRTAIALTALFLGAALFQGARGLFVSDAAPPPPPVVQETPSPSPEASPTETTSAETPKLKPFPTFAGEPPEPQSYASTEELAAALAERGIECTSLEFLEATDPTLEAFSLCDPGTSARRLNIYFYPAPANRKLWLGNLEAQKLPLPLVWGPNWIIVAAGEPKTADARLKSIQGAIGGTLEDFSPKKK